MAERRCIVTRKTENSQALLRFVAGPSGRVVPDIKGVLPGRGVWLTPRADIVRKAVRSSAFSNSLPTKNLKVDETLVDEVDKLLESTALSALALCRKAGQCVLGAHQVKASLSKGSAKGNVSALLFASDGSDSEYKKFYNLAKACGLSRNVWRLFTSAQHDEKLGSGNNVQLALLSGSASDHAISKLSNLSIYRERSVA